MDETELFSRTEFADFSRTRQQLETVNLQFETGQFATSAVRQAYEHARENLESHLAEMSSTPEFQDRLAAVGEEALSGVEQLEPIEGILAEEEIAPLKTGFLETIAVVKDFLERSGINSQEAEKFCQKAAALGLGMRAEVEVVPSPKQEPAVEPAREKGDIRERAGAPRRNLLVKKQNGHIQLGGGKPIPFSPTQDKEAGRLNWRALRVLMNHQNKAGDKHETVSPRQLWNEMGEEGEPPETFKRGWFRWSRHLTYGRSQVVAWTGKRGRGSGYAINPSYYLVVESEVDRHRHETIASSIEPGDFFIGARYLRDFDFAIKQQGLPPLNQEILRELEDFRPDFRHLQGQSEIIRQLRQEAIERFSQLLSNKDVLNSLLSSTDEDVASFRLLDYLNRLDDSQRDFLKTLMAARIERVGNGGHYRIEAIDATGHILAYADRTTTRAEPTPQDDQADNQTTASVKKTNIQPASVGKIPKKQELSEREAAQLDFLKFQVESITQDLLAVFSPNSRLTRPQIRNVFPKFSTNMVKTAKDNNVVPRAEHYKFSIEDIVRIHLFNDRLLQNFFTARKYKGLVEETIKTTIAEVVEENQREMSGEDEPEPS